MKFILLLAGVFLFTSCSTEEYKEEETESGADRQLAIWFWSRGYPDPHNINDKFFTAWLQAKAMKDAQLARTTQFSGNWTGIGPSQNIGGRILCIAIDPQNNNILFAGSASGGIWKSTTAGTGSNAWKPVITGFPVLGVSSIIIHPTNSNIIYAATGEVYRSDTSNIGFNVWKARGTYGIGILKSNDGGNTWSQVFNRNLSGLFGVQMLQFDPSNANIVYACTTDGLYRSANAGNTWTRIFNKPYISDVAINPANTNQIVAAAGNLQNIDKGIFRSTDGGATWTKITAGLPASFQGFIRLDNVSTNANMIIASIGISAGTSSNELYRSTDFGVTWSALANSNHCQYQFWFAHDVAINPSNTNQLMMGGVPLYRFTIPSARTSINGVHADIHDIEFDPSNNNIVYVACDGGVYITYHYNDDVAAIQHANIVYYRLKLVESNGAFTYSNVVRLRMPAKNELIVMGNPFANELQLQLNTERESVATINLYDAQGKLVRSKRFTLHNGNNKLKLENLSMLSQATYILEALIGNRRITRKLNHIIP